MILRRLYEDGLAQATWIVACEKSRTAIVVDANRDVERVIAAAAEARVRIVAITETHIHADFVSGARDLARRTGARLLLSGHGGAEWSYRQVEGFNHDELRDGNVVEIGQLRLRAVHTPGHTPEHITFLVTDSASATEPAGALTGDFIFVGDVGRPDLLERAAGVANSMADSARTLFRSLRAFEAHPDWLQLWPGHGAGSACGKALGAMPQTTLGYERRFNPALAIDNEEEFVREILSGQPAPPMYFARMKEWNRDGAPPLSAMPAPSRLGPAEALSGGALLLDVRDIKSFAAQHIQGSLNVPFTGSFTNYGGQVVPFGRELVLILPRADESLAAQVARSLALIGFDDVRGWIGPEIFATAASEGASLSSAKRTTSTQLGKVPNDGFVVDVRQASEFTAGHIRESMNVPLAALSSRLEELPRDSRLYVTCEGGSRSAIAGSVLRAAGFTDVVEIGDGMTGWRRAGLPMDQGAARKEEKPVSA